MTPLNDPEVGTPFVEAGPCVLKLIALEDGDPGAYGDTIKWIFTVAVAGEVLLDDDGDPHEFWQWSSTKMSPRAKAPKWLGALLGRKIVFDEDEDGWQPTTELVEEAIGKTANGMIVEEVGDSGETFTKLPEDGMTAIKAKKRARPKAKKEEEEPEEADGDDEEDLPF